ncbi:MAG: hypothetical protein K2X48_15145 [Chitinophagaceae bacterium]|nr:hypothetical protein [Chitinophagaceae bacterium]
MNIINKSLLGFVLLPSAFYKKAGVHLPHLKAILQAKLIMDDRRPNTFQQVQQRRNKEEAVSNATLGTIFISLLLGCLMLFAFAFGTDYTTKLTFFFSMYIFMLAGTLITDFTNVLIDIRDNLIILPKPVNDKTVVLARLLHIFIHVSKLSLPMCVPAIVLVSIIKGIAGGLLMLPMVFIATVFTIFLINAVYLVILKITSPERFKSFITYFQIIFGVLIFTSYQVVPRIISRAQFENFNIADIKWVWLLPSFWLGRAWEAIYLLRMNRGDLVALALSFVLPVVFIYVVITFFAPSFNRKLSMISGGSESMPTTNTTKKEKTNSSLKTKIAALFCAPGGERAAFMLSWNMMNRSREFKMKVYPAIGYLAVYIFLILFNSKTTSVSAIQTDETQKKTAFLILVYMSNMLLSAAAQNLVVSDKFKAGWIYFTAPVTQPGMLISGGIKAAIVKFFVPLAIFIAAGSMFFWGVSIIPHLILGFANQYLFCLLSCFIFVNKLPFSSPPQTASGGSSFIRGILIMMLLGILGLIHYLLFDYVPAVSIIAVIACGAAFLLMKQIQQKSWNQMKLEYQD